MDLINKDHTKHLKVSVREISLSCITVVRDVEYPSGICYCKGDVYFSTGVFRDGLFSPSCLFLRVLHRPLFVCSDNIKDERSFIFISYNI